MGGIELVRESLDLVGDGQFRLFVEVTGEGHDDERSATIGGPQGIGPRRPGIGHVEHTLESGDRAKAIGDLFLDLRIIDVDAVGNDRQLSAGLGEVIELLGHSA